MQDVGGGVRVAGWTLANASNAAGSIRVYVDSTLAYHGNTDRPRPDVAAAYPGAPELTGYDVTVGAPPGKHLICVWGVDRSNGSISLLAARDLGGVVTVLVLFEAVVILLLSVLVVGLLRSHAEILRALHDLGVNMEDGAPEPSRRTFRAGHRGDAARARSAESGVVPAGAPAAERIGAADLALPTDGPLGDAHDILGTTPLGDGVAISLRGSTDRVLLAFLTSGCQSCLGFWHAFEDAENRRVAGPRSRLVVLTKGSDQESPAAVAALVGVDFETVMSTEAFDDYSVPIAPYFVLVDSGPGRR